MKAFLILSTGLICVSTAAIGFYQGATVDPAEILRWGAVAVPSGWLCGIFSTMES